MASNNGIHPPTEVLVDHNLMSLARTESHDPCDSPLSSPPNTPLRVTSPESRLVAMATPKSLPFDERLPSDQQVLELPLDEPAGTSSALPPSWKRAPRLPPCLPKKTIRDEDEQPQDEKLNLPVIDDDEEQPDDEISNALPENEPQPDGEAPNRNEPPPSSQKEQPDDEPSHIQIAVIPQPAVAGEAPNRNEPPASSQEEQPDDEPSHIQIAVIPQPAVAVSVDEKEEKPSTDKKEEEEQPDDEVTTTEPANDGLLKHHTQQPEEIEASPAEPVPIIRKKNTETPRDTDQPHDEMDELSLHQTTVQPDFEDICASPTDEHFGYNNNGEEEGEEIILKEHSSGEEVSPPEEGAGQQEVDVPTQSPVESEMPEEGTESILVENEDDESSAGGSSRFTAASSIDPRAVLSDATQYATESLNKLFGLTGSPKTEETSTPVQMASDLLETVENQLLGAVEPEEEESSIVDQTILGQSEENGGAGIVTPTPMDTKDLAAGAKVDQTHKSQNSRWRDEVAGLRVRKESIHSISKEPFYEEGQPPSLRRRDSRSFDSLSRKNASSPYSRELVSPESQPPSLRRKKVAPDAGPMPLIDTIIQCGKKSSAPDPDASYEHEDSEVDDAAEQMTESLRAVVRERSDAVSSPGIERTESDDLTVPSYAMSMLSGSRYSMSRASRDPDAISDGLPAQISSLNSDIGIPPGDLVVSLLNASEEMQWSDRMKVCVWRCRTMRRTCDTKWLRAMMSRRKGEPARGRTSIKVDADDARVVGGLSAVSATEKSAIEHLKFDEMEDALALYDDIVECYQSFADDLARNRGDASSQAKLELFRQYTGTALHNLGIVHMMRGDFGSALNAMEIATKTREKALGKEDIDYILSLARMGTCRFALEDFEGARKDLRQALLFIKGRIRKESLSTRRLHAEILNNVACLSYICDEPHLSLPLLQEALQVQDAIRIDSLYAGSKFACQSSSLNSSVVKANIGFLALVSRSIPQSIECFQSSATEQSVLLRDADPTLTSTMDHLGVAHLLSGDRQKAKQVFTRMLHMQRDAFGPKDRRCLVTANKLQMMTTKEGREKLDSALRAIPNLGKRVLAKGSKKSFLKKALSPKLGKKSKVGYVNIQTS